MRCPKCSFISFDDLAVCAKCAGDLSVLSRELNGTCIEARPEFFLGTAIQTPSLDDGNFSDSQVLPPIDHGGINFDDTSTGGFSPVSSSVSGSSSYDFDDSMGLATEDDIAIELGDIMPIDLDQLDDTSVFSGVALADTDSFDPANFALDMDRTETINTANFDVDLDLTGKFASTNLDMALDGDFTDIDIDDSDLDFSSDTPLSPRGASVDGFRADSEMSDIERNSLDSSVGIDLDDELIAQLSTFVDDLDTSASFSSLVTSGGAAEPEAEAYGGEVEFDDALVAELTGSFPVNEALGGEGLDNYAALSGPGEFELDAAPGGVFDDIDLDDRGDETSFSLAGGSFGGASAETPIEDLTGEFSPISYTEEPELGDLNLSDIDVTDLIEPSSADNVLLASDNAAVDVGVPVEDLTGEFVPSAFDDEVELDEELLLSEDTESVEAVSLDQLLVAEDSAVFGDVSGVAGETEMSLPIVEDVALEAGAFSGELFEEVDISELENDLSDSFNVSADNVAAEVDDGLPEIELIPDDDEGPPDLPS